MRYLGCFRVERCPSHGTACKAQGTTVGPWACVDPRDKSHAGHADTKVEAQAAARLFRRAREESIRQEEVRSTCRFCKERLVATAIGTPQGSFCSERCLDYFREGVIVR